MLAELYRIATNRAAYDAVPTDAAYYPLLKALHDALLEPTREQMIASLRAAGVATAENQLPAGALPPVRDTPMKFPLR
jgi:hypothetical protein